MTKDEFAGFLLDIHKQETQVRSEGQREYAHDDTNCFDNFDRLADQLKLTREQILLVYAGKHWDGIVSYVAGHRSQREDIRGRIKDMRMYLALLWGMLDEGEKKEAIVVHPSLVNQDTELVLEEGKLKLPKCEFCGQLASTHILACTHKCECQGYEYDGGAFWSPDDS